MTRLTHGVGVGRRIPIILVLLTLAGCGGGGGNDNASGGTGPTGGGSSSNWTPGVYQPSSSFANRCAAPRSGTADLSGSAQDENNFLRSWTNELYLWYSEVTDRDPGQYNTANYFDLLKTTQLTSTGHGRDRFHFTYPTDVWQSLSQGGVEVSYGLQWALLAAQPPRKAMIAYLESNPPSATASANLTRGVEVLEVDGVDLVNVATQQGVDALNAGLFPETAGESHTFRVRDVGTSNTRTVTLVSASFTSTPVQTVRTFSTANGTVGYFLFNDHVATAEGGLINAINTLKTANISDLILDIRYNSGGYLAIASEIAYMIAGPALTSGQTFERLQFNDKYPNRNPVTGQTLTPTPFYNTTQGLQSGLPAGQSLPTLNLPRVFLLTGPNTCSASESIINGLRGVGVNVYLIGSTTCGKPYGFYPQDNCGTTYFSIQFRGINAAGFGDYADGFSPANSSVPTNATVAGCSVADDFGHDLGDVNEGRLAAALSFRSTLSCAGPPTGIVKPFAFEESPATETVVVPKSPWRQNRIVSPN